MAESTAPFQLIEDTLNNVPIEEQPDGSFLIGTPEVETTEDLELREWDSNLITTIEPEELGRLASTMLSDYDDDVNAREEWLRVYTNGLETLKPDERQHSKQSGARDNRNLTNVVHPMIAEAATQFQAKAINELFPAKGPVGATVIGEATEETQRQADRVSTYMNYQLTDEMPEYFPDLDQMLFHLPLVGQTYKKCWFDINLRRVTSRFVQAEDFVIDSGATDLESASRYSHVLRIPKHEYSQYVANGFYEPVEFDDGGPEESTVNDVDGIEPIYSNNAAPVELIEVHAFSDILNENEDEPDKPVVVTIHMSSEKIVALRRNWDEEDTRFRKNTWFVSYKFLPGLGPYGYGLYHVIGGLGKAATGALRSLLDAAAYSNMTGGFKLRGRVKGGDMEIAPGEFTDIDAAVDDVKKAIMPLPFKEPSQTMMQLLQFVVTTGKQFANTIESNLSDANQNTPVGTTMAMLEENSRVFSAVHKRLHNSQRKEFKLIAKLNGIYLPDRYPYRTKTQDVILRNDFDDRIDVIPVSDPNTFSSTQRIAQAQAMMQMATQFPQYHDQYAALRRMYEAIRMPNYDEILKNPDSGIRRDAVTENSMIMLGRPVKAFEDQDHMAHITVLDDFYRRLPPEQQQQFFMPYVAHRAEHTAFFYRVMIQSQMAAPMPPLGREGDDIPPLPLEIDNQISQAAATIVNENPQPMIGPPPPPAGEQQNIPDPMQQAQMAMQIEAQATQAKAQADIEAKMQKAQIDMQIKMAQSQMDMEIERIRAQARIEENRIRNQNQQEINEKELEAQIEQLILKTESDIQIAKEKAEASMEVEKERAASQIAISQVKAERE
jgi:hypothetical protein|tara:strand:+ start:192 stop:2690 length:2499 start_codon:yes stop_codon:yes gene_type:complete